jgi:dihydroorotate dehydrogenase electron transfer subunit
MQLNTRNKIKGPHIVEVLSNIKLSDDTRKLVFRNQTIAENAKPGQFVSILCEDLLLRRPFSVANSKDDTFEIIYKIKGKGTKYLSDLKSGDSTDIIGPLGNGFSIENKNSLLIGCGVGIAPIVFLSDILKKSDIKHTFVACSQTSLCHCEERIVGRGWRDSLAGSECRLSPTTKQGQSPDVAICPNNNVGQILTLASLAENDNSIMITEDGSAGLEGRLDSHLENIINQTKPEKIYTCGPNPAMKYIVQVAEKYKIPVEVALERDFACGTGVCMGCVVQIKENDKPVNKRICKDGPVFRGNEVLW